MDKDIIDICKYVCDNIEKYDLVSENTPTSKASGSIYLVSYLFDLDITKKNVVVFRCIKYIPKCFTKLLI